MGTGGMNTLIHQRVAEAQRGQNPTVLCRMPSGWAVIGDAQFLRGYCLLLPAPVVPDLNALDEAGRARFLLDMAVIGDALLEVTGAYRINYEILGNTEPMLHAHIFPRYTSEPDDLRRGPAFFYPAEIRASAPLDLTRDRGLMDQLAAAIRRRL